MLDRLVITFIVIGGLGLLWMGWHYYKSRLVQTIQPAGQSTRKPTILYFTADYCRSCKFQQAPIIDQLATSFGNSISVEQYDVSEQPELASRYKVMTLPTTVVLNSGGQVTHINYGVTPQGKLEAQLL